MRKIVLRFSAMLLIVGGITVSLYPTIAGWFAQLEQSKIVNAISAQTQMVDPSKQAQMAAAAAYNDALASGAIVGANQRIPTGTGTASHDGVWPYRDILDINGEGLMGRVKIPKIDVDLPIYHGTDDKTLLRGAGHLEGTSLPIGGVGTRAVVTAHRGLAQAKMFTRLDELLEGDLVEIQVFDEVLAYRVFDIQVVEPTESQAIQADPNRDMLTLITCTPLGINSHRILVTAERVFPTPESVHDDLVSNDLPRFPWWMIVLAVLWLGGITWFVVGIRQDKKNENKQTNQQTAEKHIPCSDAVDGVIR